MKTPPLSRSHGDAAAARRPGAAECHRQAGAVRGAERARVREDDDGEAEGEPQILLPLWGRLLRLLQVQAGFGAAAAAVQAKSRYRGYDTDPATAPAVSPTTGCSHPSSSGHSFCGGTYPAESVEPAAAGAASPCHETGASHIGSGPCNRATNAESFGGNPVRYE